MDNITGIGRTAWHCPVYYPTELLQILVLSPFHQLIQLNPELTLQRYITICKNLHYPGSLRLAALHSVVFVAHQLVA